MTLLADEGDATGSATPPGPERLVMRRRKVPRWLQAVAVVLTIVLAYGCLTLVQVWQASRETDAPPADAIVVLGAAQYNGRPSPALADRLAHALTLYRRGVAPLLVVTGGRRQGDRFTEATTGYNWLRRRSVPDSAIVKEVRGRSTYESLRAVATILHGRNLRNVVLVSNPAHAKRIGEVSGEVGLRPHVSPVTGSAGFASLLRETGAVAVGRLIGYRRLEQLGR